MKKKLLVLMLCGLALSFASASGSGESRSSEKMELTFFYPVNVGGPLTALIDKICADFNP